jgi:hypothetical protein
LIIGLHCLYTVYVQCCGVESGSVERKGKPMARSEWCRRAAVGCCAALAAALLSAIPAAAEEVHWIQPGETLSGIAARYGAPVELLAWHNRIADPNLIYAGEQLVIPASGGGVPASGGRTLASTRCSQGTRSGASRRATA